MQNTLQKLTLAAYILFFIAILGIVLFFVMGGVFFDLGGSNSRLENYLLNGGLILAGVSFVLSIIVAILKATHKPPRQ